MLSSSSDILNPKLVGYAFLKVHMCWERKTGLYNHNFYIAMI